MPEELGTVNLKQGTQTREIELLRRHYRTHRDSLARLIGDAPTEHLASEYQRLVSEIDMAVRKLDELEGKPSTAAASPIADTNPTLKTGPGTRPLVRTNEPVPPPAATAYRPPAASTGVQSRVAMILIAGVVVLVIIGWLIWRASSERKSAAPVVEQQPVSATNNAPPAVTPAPVAAAPILKINPAVADYGTIRKGTRAVRQFQVTNTTNGVVEIEVRRSNCRCLFYDYNGKLPARGRETITVTVDGARAKAGPLKEQIDVHPKNEPSASVTIIVQATIR
jgi:hypothetical protein